MLRRKSITNKIIVFTLVLGILFSSMTVKYEAHAEEKGKQYVSEVKLGFGKTAQEAAKQLLDEGYTILTSDTPNKEVDADYQSYADLNRGGSSSNIVARKGTAIVYLGYKTTDNPKEAITDLAAMNMKGGYSFSQYMELLKDHKDQVINPFIEKFMGTIKEYRTNYNSSNPDNKAKAVLIHDLLNRIRDDDTGMGMGDLFLAETKDEMGETAYKALSDDEKKKHGDLGTILMQGQGSVILIMEQMLAIAADTSNDTWMERFTDMGPDGVSKKFTDSGMTPADAEKKAAGQYGDTAKALADKWVLFRSSLLEYQDSDDFRKAIASEENGDADYGEAVDEKPLTPEERKKAYEEPLDVEEDPELQEKIDSIPEIDENSGVEDYMTAMETRTELNNEAAAAMSEMTIGMIYWYLASVPYGKGTLLDFFLQSHEEVSGDNLKKLYPVAAALSEGQISGLDFLSMEQLVRIGITDSGVFSSLRKNVDEMLKGLPDISVYENVDREIFSDGVALTNEALRKNSNVSDIYTKKDWTLSIALDTFLCACGVISGVACGKVVQSALKGVPITYMATRTVYVYKHQVEDFKWAAQYLTSYVKGNDDWYLRVMKTDSGHLRFYNANDTSKEVFAPLYEGYLLPDEGKSVYKSGMTEKVDDFIEKCKNVQEGNMTYVAQVNGTGVAWTKWAVAGVFGVVALGMVAYSAYSLYKSYEEMKAYYHQEMTKIPKYVVDEVDITRLDENGNKTFVRNDTAYYRAVLCNRTSASEDYRTMKEFGDLNGDVGRQWLALYYVKQGTTPILADSLKVVMGTADIPEGYETGIHMIGEKSMVNMTDSRYTYNDDMKGIYVYYKLDAAVNLVKEPSGTASVIGTGIIVAIGAGCAVLGVVVGAVIAVLIRKKKESGLEEEEA